MKRLAAILLFGIFAFNLFGYQLIASFLENRENNKIELALDENEYSDSQLISIKQPTNLPYYQNSKDFQRVDGEVEIDGIEYKYVKSRIYNDSLELLCIPNTGKMKIKEAKNDFSKLASDFQQSTNKKKSSDSKSFHKTISDFEAQDVAIALNFNIPHSTYFTRNNSFVKDLFTKTAEQPPDSPSTIS